MHKNLQHRYLATLRKCATPMPTFVAQTVTTQPQRQQQVVQKQQQEIQPQSYAVSSPKRYALPPNFGRCFDCFHVAAVTSFVRSSTRSHGTSATVAAATATTRKTPVTTATATAAADSFASAEAANFLITNTTKTTSANQQTRGAKVKLSAEILNVAICVSLWCYFLLLLQVKAFWIFLHAHCYVYAVYYAFE